MNGAGRYAVVDRARVFDGFLKIDEVTYEIDGLEGQQKRQVMERGDSAAILLFNKDRREVVLVEQFRIAARREEAPDEAWLLELPAGVIEADTKGGGTRPEDPLTCARREAKEETGYEVGAAQHIATILPSPGGTSERIHIFYGVVGDRDRISEGGGQPEEGELVRVVHLTLAELNRKIAASRSVDAKLLVALQWLQAQPRKEDPLPPGERCFAFAADLNDPRWKKNPRIIGYQQGVLDEMENIDIWVNAENTDMQMARFFDPGISGRIRWLGAAKTSADIVLSDTIAQALREKLVDQVAVRPSTVITTTSGDLRYSHGVKKLLHVACAQHSLQGKTVLDIDTVAAGFRRALLEAHYMSRSWWRRCRVLPPIRSMLVPLIGAGNAGGSTADIATAMVRVAMRHFERHEDAPFRKLFFIAFKPGDKDIFDALFAERVREGQLVEFDAGGVRRRQKRPHAPPKVTDGTPQPEPAASPQQVSSPA